MRGQSAARIGSPGRSATLTLRPVTSSAGDYLPIWPLTAAVFKNAPHPNAAKLFLSWLLEPEQQEKLGTWSPRSDVAPPAGEKPILSYKVANDYRAFLTDQAQVAALRARSPTITSRPSPHVGSPSGVNQSTRI